MRDHCHISGKYPGAAHNACNHKLRLNPKTTSIPVVFQNLWGSDSHLLTQAISKVEGRVSCSPNNTEKYISFLGQLRFIDSAQFLLSSLDTLVAANPPEAFQITAQHESNRERRELKIKGMLADSKAMRMTQEDWLAFRTAETCHVCDKPLEGDSVRDHCHISGKYPPNILATLP